jgi:hypothetical protein
VTAFVEIFLAMIEVVKAELRYSKVNFFSFLAALTFLLAGMFFLVAAFILALVAAGLALDKVLPTPVAVLVIGLITSLLGFVLIFLGRRAIRQ